jgi:hypothetical protein
LIPLKNFQNCKCLIKCLGRRWHRYRAQWESNSSLLTAWKWWMNKFVKELVHWRYQSRMSCPTQTAAFSHVLTLFSHEWARNSFLLSSCPLSSTNRLQYQEIFVLCQKALYERRPGNLRTMPGIDIWHGTHIPLLPVYCIWGSVQYRL